MVSIKQNNYSKAFLIEMTSIKISELPEDTSPTDDFYVSQANKRTTIAKVLANLELSTYAHP